MSLLIAYNPRSGHGQARRAAESLSWSLRRGGHEAALVAVGPDEQAGAFTEALPGNDAVVVVGGDGTLHHLLRPLVASRTPVYHLPMGTENLFAREFGSDRSPARLLAALAAQRVVDADVGEVTLGDAPARPFALMCSIGPDAAVTQRVAERRKSGTAIAGRLGFVTPALVQLLRPTLPRFTITVDGLMTVKDEKGLLVIANSRQYALRIDPATRASMTDGLLDVVFFPCGSSLGALSWLVRSRLRSHLTQRRLIYRGAREVEVVCDADTPMPVQLDGEGAPTAAHSLRIGVRPGALRVLVG